MSNADDVLAGVPTIEDVLPEVVAARQREQRAWYAANTARAREYQRRYRERRKAGTVRRGLSEYERRTLLRERRRLQVLVDKLDAKIEELLSKRRNT